MHPNSLVSATLVVLLAGVTFAAAPAYSASDPASSAAPLSSGEDQVSRTLREAATLRSKGSFDAALGLCRHALAIDRKSCDAYAEMAETYAAQGHFGEAVRWFREAIGDNPTQTWSHSRMEDGDLHFRFTLVLLKAGRYEDALRVFKIGRERITGEERRLVNGKWNAKDLTNNVGDRQRFEVAARIGLGAKYLELAQPDQAIEQLKEAHAMMPGGDATAQYLLGKALLLKGDQTGARAAWQQVAAAANAEGAVKENARKALEQNR